MKNLKEICIAFDVPTVSNEIFNRFNLKKKQSLCINEHQGLYVHDAKI